MQCYNERLCAPVIKACGPGADLKLSKKGGGGGVVKTWAEGIMGLIELLESEGTVQGCRRAIQAHNS